MVLKKNQSKEQNMTQLNITLNEETLKEPMLGNRDEALRKLLEAVFNAILKAEASEQVGADLYERTDERQTYRNGYRERQFKTRALWNFSYQSCVTALSRPHFLPIMNEVRGPWFSPLWKWFCKAYLPAKFPI